MTAEDFTRGGRPFCCYPLEMLRALTAVWLFAGLRSNEILCLRVGCVRLQEQDLTIPQTGETLPKRAVCLLDVPVNKTGTAFTKPVDPFVGEAIATWERVRPEQPALLDRKTGELVHFLFCYRARRAAVRALNWLLIPTLCAKAGISTEDARGKITSHRARSTIASQLFNARQPMSLFERRSATPGRGFDARAGRTPQLRPARLCLSLAAYAHPAIVSAGRPSNSAAG